MVRKKAWISTFAILVTILLIYLYFPFSIFTAFAPSPSTSNLPVEKINLPEGFKITVFAEDVPGARSMALETDDGTVLFVGTRNTGKVYALVDKNRDFIVDKKYTIADGLNMPNGVALKDGDLYVAEVGRIIKFGGIAGSLENPPEPVVVNDDFPGDRYHGWKFIRFGPDGKLYVPVGAPCNVCDRGDPYASILRMNPDGSELEVFARGVRNTVGFDWSPLTQELWFTDNGRDWLGDDLPPDELNTAPEKGLHFGFPYCHGKDIKDPEFNRGENCSDGNFTQPAQELGPHVASLGMRFYTGDMFPKEYENGIFIAEHGSWNRKTPIGYRITFVELDKDGKQPISYRVFADGWLEVGIAWGRPVDVLVMPDGSLMVSDDKAGAIYRIYYEK